LCVRFDREGRRLATGSRDRSIRIWSLRGKLERTIDAHAKGVDVLCFGSDDELISGGGDGGVSVWSWPKGVARLEIDAHDGPVYTLGVSRDGKLIASGGAGRHAALLVAGDRRAGLGAGRGSGHGRRIRTRSQR
jgi:WD40 repeat protein